MSRSPQNCRTARSQPSAAKHLLCTMAGFVDAPAYILAVKMAGGEGVSQCLADGGFVVVAALVGGVDAAKAGVDGHPHEAGGLVFLPRRAVEEGRGADVAHAGVACGLPVFRHG